MQVGDKVKLKINNIWYEAEIVNLYSDPDDWSLVDVKLFDTGEIVRGISSRDIYGI